MQDPRKLKTQIAPGCSFLDCTPNQFADPTKGSRGRFAFREWCADSTREAEMEAYNEETALEVVQEKPTTLIKPLVSPDDLIEHHKQITNLIERALVKDQDYGIIPGTKRPTLLKPGAERIAIAFGTAPIYSIVESEIDHNRMVEWTKRKKKWRNQFQGDRHFDWEEESGTSTGLYRYVVRCDLQHRKTTEVIGSGIGTCSTMESKYIDRPRETENTIIKMAQKRALVAAVLNAFGLSDRFTQDVEDMDHEDPRPRSNSKPTPQQKADAQTKAQKWTDSIWNTLSNSGHPDPKSVWKQAGIDAEIKGAATAEISQQKKFKESVLSQIDDWRSSLDPASEEAIAHDTGPLDDMPPGPAEEYGKQMVSGDQIDHLVETAKIANPDLHSAERVLHFCRTATKRFDLQRLEDLTIDQYEGVLDLLNTRTGDQPFLPMNEGRGS